MSRGVFVIVGSSYEDACLEEVRIRKERPDVLHDFEDRAIKKVGVEDWRRLEGLRVEDFAFSIKALRHFDWTETYDVLRRSQIKTNYRL